MHKGPTGPPAYVQYCEVCSQAGLYVRQPSYAASQLYPPIQGLRILQLAAGAKVLSADTLVSLIVSTIIALGIVSLISKCMLFFSRAPKNLQN
jgi:hypothetical protein